MHVRRYSNLVALKPTIVDEIRVKRVTKINQYILGPTIGIGSNAKVVLALDENTNIKYAAKVVKIGHARNSNVAAQLEREIRIMNMLNHPNILKLHEVLHRKSNNTVYMIMDYANCGTIQDLIKSKQLLSETAIASIFRQIVCGLKYLYSQGITHRDLKPSNILLFDQGAVKISDFGIVHSFQSADQVVGSPAYQAPEFFDDDDEIEIDPVKEDIWSLGVTLYETAFGQIPFSGENAYEINYQVLNSDLVIPDTVSKELKDLISKMLSTDPTTRISLDEIEKHPFMAKALENYKFDLKIKDIVIPNDRVSDAIECEICREGYSFAAYKRRNSFCMFSPISEI